MVRKNWVVVLLILALSIIMIFSCSEDEEDERQPVDQGDDDTNWTPGDDDTIIYDELVWLDIPGDTFEMGCSFGDDECSGSEGNGHNVTLSDFQMTETEITQEQLREVLGLVPSNHSGCNACPADNVTFAEAKKFCKTVGGRLPTEAEWEYAARGGEETKYYCGNHESCLEEIAWFNDNSDGATHKVKRKDPNEFGLYDMLGNVIEWVNDYYDYYYETDDDTNPKGPSSGSYRVIRGGGFYSYDSYLRVSCRDYTYPEDRDTDLGFRCVRNVN